MASRSTPTTSTAEAPAPAPAPRPWWDPSRLAARSVFPALLQAPALGVLLFMIAAGWGLHGVDGVAEDGPLLYTNLATFGFWVLWFMALVLLLPLVGRVWCTVCPVGWVNDAAARWGLRRGWPRALQSYLPGGAVLLGFSLAAEAFAFNRYPDRTASMLAVVLAAALVAGLLFRGRVFCRYLCPVGGMIGLYARLAPEGVGCRDPEVCRRCDSKACFFGSERRYRLTLPGWTRTFAFRRPGCPAFVYPPEASGNAACLQCTQCFKNCPYDNLRWGGRRPLAGLWQGRTRDRSEATLVVVLAGIVFYRLARFWGALREGVEWPAAKVAAALPFVDATAFKALKLLAGFVLWPSLFLLLLAALAKLAAESSLGPAGEAEDGPAGGALLPAAPDVDERFAEERRRWMERRRTVRGYLAAYSLAFVPLLAGAFQAFAVVKLNEKLAYFPHVVADPAGVRTYLAMNQVRVIVPPESLLPLPVVRWVALAALAAGALASLWAVRRVGAAVYGAGSRAATRGAVVFQLGLAALSAVLLFCLKNWLFRG